MQRDPGSNPKLLFLTPLVTVPSGVSFNIMTGAQHHSSSHCHNWLRHRSPKPVSFTAITGYAIGLRKLSASLP